MSNLFVGILNLLVSGVWFVNWKLTKKKISLLLIIVYFLLGLLYLFLFAGGGE